MKNNERKKSKNFEEIQEIFKKNNEKISFIENNFL